MHITYNPAKRSKALVARGLDLEDAETVFAGLTYEIEDKRNDCGETRIICYG